MIWAKGALVCGLLVLGAGFAVGTEDQLTTSVQGQTHDCGPAISASWLVPGTPDQTQPGPSATDEERRAAAVCGPVVQKSRVLVVTTMSLGCVLAVVGWVAVRRRMRTAPRPVRAVRA